MKKNIKKTTTTTTETTAAITPAAVEAKATESKESKRARRLDEWDLVFRSRPQLDGAEIVKIYGPRLAQISRQATIVGLAINVTVNIYVGLGVGDDVFEAADRKTVQKWLAEHKPARAAYRVRMDKPTRRAYLKAHRAMKVIKAALDEGIGNDRITEAFLAVEDKLDAAIDTCYAAAR
jgi:hypothetical protein